MPDDRHHRHNHGGTHAGRPVLIRIPVVAGCYIFWQRTPEQIESGITLDVRTIFSLWPAASDHIGSRSLPGVSLINLLSSRHGSRRRRRLHLQFVRWLIFAGLPPGTALPPVVLQFDASQLPAPHHCSKGEGLNEAQLRDLGQYNVRNQVANVPGASSPATIWRTLPARYGLCGPAEAPGQSAQPHGQQSRRENNSNLILPAGDVRIGNLDYNLYTNSQLPSTKEINAVPLKTLSGASVMVADVGSAQDAQQIQTNVVRLDGQKSVYLPVDKVEHQYLSRLLVNGVGSGQDFDGYSEKLENCRSLRSIPLR